MAGVRRRRHATDVPDGCPLTSQQLRAIKGLADGKVYKQIALDLGISPSTVRTHLHWAYDLLGVRDRANAVIMCYEKGWLGPTAKLGDSPLPEVTVHTYITAFDHAARHFQRSAETDADEDDALTPLQRMYATAYDRHRDRRTDNGHPEIPDTLIELFVNGSKVSLRHGRNATDQLKPVSSRRLRPEMQVALFALRLDAKWRMEQAAT